MIDWSASRQDAFEFYMLAYPSAQEVPLTGISGGSISWNYNSDNKVSGTLKYSSIDSGRSDILFNKHVRVYYCPTVDGQKYKIELATGYVTSTTGTFHDRLFTGEITFQSELLRYTDDELPRDWILAKGIGALDYYKSFHKNFGNALYKWENIQNKPFTSNKVIEFGKRPMDVLQYIATFVGGEIGVDSHGRVVLRKYVAPANKPVSYTFPTGEDSIIYGNLDVEETWNGTPNRVVVRHKWQENSKDRILYGTAQIGSTSTISANNQNRWITRTYDESEMSPKTQAKINAIAKTRLAQNTAVNVFYTFSCYYAPIEIGQVVRFRYGKFDVDGLVQSIDMDLNPGAPMKVKVKRVRYR